MSSFINAGAPKTNVLGTTEAQQITPAKSYGSIKQGMANVVSRNHSITVNELMNKIENKLVGTKLITAEQSNPFAWAQSESMPYGSRYEELMARPLSALDYGFANVDNREILRNRFPSFDAAYYGMNFYHVIPFTWNEHVLREAAAGAETIQDMLAAVMAQADSLDNLIMYTNIKDMLIEWQRQVGYFNVNVADIVNGNPSQITDGMKLAVRDMLSLADDLRLFLSKNYSQAGIPVNSNELKLITTHKFKRTLDVFLMAAAYNPEYLELPFEYSFIDAPLWDGFQALLVDRNFIIWKDAYREMHNSPLNGFSLNEMFYLHHKGMLHLSVFLPAVLFSTSQTTGLTDVTESVTAVAGTVVDVNEDGSLGSAVAEVAPGGRYGIKFEVTGSVNPADLGIYVKPTSFYVKSIYIDGVETDPLKTYIDGNGYLYVQDFDLHADYEGNLNIELVSAYLNPDNTTSEFTSTINIPVGE